MIASAQLAWSQLAQQPARFAVALAGVVFAVVLILMQLGFSDALYASSVRLHERLTGDLVLIHPHYLYLANSKPFSQRRLYQAQQEDGVATVSRIYYELAPWKHPQTGSTRNLLVLGVEPIVGPLNLANLSDPQGRVRVPEKAWFDRQSRPEFGFAESYRVEKPLLTEINNRRVEIAGTYDLGPSFAVDGSIVTSEDNFLRLLPHRRRGLIDIGVIALQPGADVRRVQLALTQRLPHDVLVLTKAEFIAREQGHWRRNTPIGYVFGFGVLMSFVVGSIIVYQILFVNVADRLRDYATLKAIGYRDRYLYGIVLEQAGLLAVLGFAPGAFLCMGLYSVTASATRLPMVLSFETCLLVFGLTLLMCAFSGAAALRKVSAADPAEVFA